MTLTVFSSSWGKALIHTLVMPLAKLELAKPIFVIIGARIKTLPEDGDEREFLVDFLQARRIGQ
jgi:hypothetical protein